MVSTNRQNVAAPLLDSQFEGISIQIPSTTPADKTQQSTNATELSASEQRLLQHLGWTLGRRGLEALKALVDKSPAPPPSGANSHQALKTFWRYFFGLSWLSHQEEKEQLVHAKQAQQAQHEATLAAQQAQHDNFELAQQALQQAAQQAQHESTQLQRVHGDVLYPMSSRQESPEQDSMASVGQVVTKDADSSELLHFNLVKQPVDEGFPKPVLVSSHGAQGTEAFFWQTLCITCCVSNSAGHVFSIQLQHTTEHGKRQKSCLMATYAPLHYYHLTASWCLHPYIDKFFIQYSIKHFDQMHACLLTSANSCQT